MAPYITCFSSFYSPLLQKQFEETMKNHLETTVLRRLSKLEKSIGLQSETSKDVTSPDRTPSSVGDVPIIQNRETPGTGLRR